MSEQPPPPQAPPPQEQPPQAPPPQQQPPQEQPPPPQQQPPQAPPQEQPQQQPPQQQPPQEQPPPPQQQPPQAPPQEQPQQQPPQEQPPPPQQQPPQAPPPQQQPPQAPPPQQQPPQALPPQEQPPQPAEQLLSNDEIWSQVQHSTQYRIYDTVKETIRQECVKGCSDAAIKYCQQEKAFICPICAMMPRFANKTQISFDQIIINPSQFFKVLSSNESQKRYFEEMTKVLREVIESFMELRKKYEIEPELKTLSQLELKKIRQILNNQQLLSENPTNPKPILNLHQLNSELITLLSQREQRQQEKAEIRRNFFNELIRNLQSLKSFIRQFRNSQHFVDTAFLNEQELQRYKAGYKPPA